MRLECDASLISRDLSGRIIVITGATSGIGKTTAFQLIKMGAHVVLACRNVDAANALVEKASALKGTAEAFICDVGSLASIRAFVSSFSEKHKSLHCLINNAGIMKCPYGKTVDGFEKHIGTNFLGPFLLTSLLLPLLKASGEGRVVNVSSANHDVFAGKRGHVDLEDLHFDHRKYDGWLAYGQSKLAQVLHARELSRRCPSVVSLSLHPGSICTNVTRSMMPFWMRLVTIPLERCLVGQVSSWVGIQTTLYCAVAEREALASGGYYSQNQSPWGVKGGWPAKSGNPEATDDKLASALWMASAALRVDSMLSDEEDVEAANSTDAGAPKRPKRDAKPSFRLSRDAALSSAFGELSQARGALPEALSHSNPGGDAPQSDEAGHNRDALILQAYLTFIERGCVRELFGLIENFRPPKDNEWRDWPVLEKDRAELRETLLLVGSRGDNNETSTLQLHVAHLRKVGDHLELLLSEAHAAYANVLPGSRQVKWAEAAVRKRSPGDVIFCVVQYVGDQTTTLAMTRQYANETASPILKALVAAGQRVGATWITPKDLNAKRSILLNESQHAALASMKHNVELICGPPGTGKSTTIHAMVMECVPSNEPALITAVQNRAIEAIAQKFIAAGTPFIVAGRRPTGVACEWTLNAQLERDNQVKRAKEEFVRYKSRYDALNGVLKERMKLFYDPEAEGSRRALARNKLVRDLVKSAIDGEETDVWMKSGFKGTLMYRQWRVDYNTTRRRKCRASAHALQAFVEDYVARAVNPCAKVARAILRHLYPSACRMLRYLRMKVEEAEYEVTKATSDAREKLIKSARAVLCTSASVSPALRDSTLQPVFASVTTMIGDEAGCIDDTHVLPILVSCTTLVRMALVGDSKQLGVFSYIREADLESLMMRLEKTFNPHLLSLQYRMQPALSSIVSECFYDGKVKSGIEASTDAPPPIRFISVLGTTHPEREGGTSMINEEEAQKAAELANHLALEYPSQDKNIVVLCLHRAQMRRVAKLVLYENTEVLTIDSSQGREWDHVVISLVSVVAQGSVTDRRKQCVMLSRAKITLTLIAHPEVVAELPALSTFREACINATTISAESDEEPTISPPSALPSHTSMPLGSLSAPPPREVSGPLSPTEVSDPSDDSTRRARFDSKQRTWQVLAADLAPTRITQRRYGATLKVIEKAVKSATKDTFTVVAVEPAGSHAKGTDTEASKDLDVVVKIEPFEPSRLSDYLDWVQSALREGNVDVTEPKSTPKAFKFDYQGNLTIDVLVSGVVKDEEWLSKLASMSERDRQCWRISCTGQAQQFVEVIHKAQPMCKDVVRIAKYWRDVTEPPADVRPPSYLLELLVFHALMQKDAPCLSVEQGFIAFLRVVVDYKALWVEWNAVWFKEDDIPPEVLVSQPPLILDPTDPANNVATRVTHWDKFATLAESMLKRLA